MWKFVESYCFNISFIGSFGYQRISEIYLPISMMLIILPVSTRQISNLLVFRVIAAIVLGSVGCQSKQAMPTPPQISGYRSLPRMNSPTSLTSKDAAALD